MAVTNFEPPPDNRNQRDRLDSYGFTSEDVDALARALHAGLKEYGNGYVEPYATHESLVIDGSYDLRKIARRLLLAGVSLRR